MKKNFFKKLAATLAFAMVVTSVAPAATASAAAASITGAASTVYATKAYKLKLGAGVNAKWTSSNKSIATVGLTGGVLKPVKPGKVTITAKSTKTGKTYKKTFTVKQRATSVELGNDVSLAVGDSTTLKAQLTPSTSTDVVRYFSDNKEVATVGMTGGKVTAKKAGEATITVYAKATTASSNASKMNKVDTIKVKVGTFIESAVQDTVKKLDVTFNADMKDVKAEDFSIVKEGSNEKLAIKSAKSAGKKVVIETYNDINDGGTYVITYGESDYKFVASNGKVVTLAIGPATITYDKPTEIKLYAKDANGVVVKEFAYGEEDSEYDFTIEPKDGYTDDTKLVLPDVGDTAIAKATYHTYEYGTDGKEIGAISTELTITAVEASAFTASEYKYTVDDETPDWDNFTQNIKLAIDEEDQFVYVQLIDANGDVVDTEDFSLESNDDDILIVNDETTENYLKAEVRAVDKGTAYVLVRDEKDKVVLSLPITIVAERSGASIVLSESTLNVSNVLGLGDTASTDVKLKDQYGKELDKSDVAISVECTSTTAEDAAGKDLKDSDVDENEYYKITSGKVTFYGNKLTDDSQVEKGTYKYKITAEDKNTEKEFSKTVTVKVEEASTSSNKKVTYKLSISDKSPDVVFKNSDTDPINIDIKVAELQDGVVRKYVSLTGASIDLEVNDDDVTTGVSISGDTLTLTALGVDDVNDVVSKAKAGNYTVEIKFTDYEGKSREVNGSFTIKDTQSGITVSRDDNEVEADTFTEAILEAFDFTYRGDDLEDDLGLDTSDIISYDIDGVDYPADDDEVKEGKTYRLNEVTFYVDVDGYDVPFTVKVNKSFTIED